MLQHKPHLRSAMALAWVAIPVLVLFPPASAMAQGAVGQLNAVAGPPLPAGTPIAVQAREFTDPDKRLKEVVEKALIAQGYTVQSDAPFVLTFDTQMSNQTDPGPPGVGEDPVEAVAEDMEQTPGWNDAGGELGRDRLDLDNSDIESIPLGSSAESDQSHYSLSFILGRGGSPAIWQGSVSAEMPNGDPFEIAETMVPILTRYIGQTVRGKQVTID